MALSGAFHARTSTDAKCTPSKHCKSRSLILKTYSFDVNVCCAKLALGGIGKAAGRICSEASFPPGSTRPGRLKFHALQHCVLPMLSQDLFTVVGYRVCRAISQSDSLAVVSIQLPCSAGCANILPFGIALFPTSTFAEWVRWRTAWACCRDDARTEPLVARWL